MLNLSKPMYQYSFELFNLSSVKVLDHTLPSMILKLMTLFWLVSPPSVLHLLFSWHTVEQFVLGLERLNTGLCIWQSRTQLVLPPPAPLLPPALQLTVLPSHILKHLSLPPFTPPSCLERGVSQMVCDRLLASPGSASVVSLGEA